MKMFAVFFKKEKNYNISYPQNFNPYVGSASFDTLEEAQAFAATKEDARIYRCGVRI